MRPCSHRPSPDTHVDLERLSPGATGEEPVEKRGKPWHNALKGVYAESMCVHLDVFMREARAKSQLTKGCWEAVNKSQQQTGSHKEGKY